MVCEKIDRARIIKRADVVALWIDRGTIIIHSRFGRCGGHEYEKMMRCFKRQLHIPRIVRVCRIILNVVFLQESQERDLAFHTDMFAVMLEQDRDLHQLFKLDHRSQVNKEKYYCS